MVPFTLMEAILYNLVRAVPLILLAFYPFRGKRRFSPEITALLHEAILLTWMFISLFNVYFSESAIVMVIVEMMGFILIATLYVAANKSHPGRMLFFCFMLINVGYMTTVTSKCLEGYLFPDLVMDRYRWSATLCLAIVSPLILIPVFYFMKWEKDTVTQEMQPNYIWQFSWLVPTTFYLIWAQEFYGTGSPLIWATNVYNVIFLGIVNLGSFLIYYLILRLVRDNARYMHLREENHVLALQVMQYEDLNQRISTASQGRHDLRHHIVTIENMVNDGNLEELKKEQSRLARYMFRYLSMMLSICGTLLNLDGSIEALEKKKKLWKDILQDHPELRLRLKYCSLATVSNLPGRVGRKIELLVYHIADKVVKFN